MRPPFRRRSLSMTSLIDVIFLLLMFFMLASSFSRGTEIALFAQSGGGTATARQALFLQLSPETIRLNGREILPAALEAALPSRPRVLVSLAPGVDSQRLANLLVVLRRVPEMQVQVLG